MPNMFSDANPKTTLLMRVRRKVGIINLVIDRLIALKLKQGAYIRSRASENLKQDGTIKSLGSSMVEDEADVHQAQQQPAEICWGTDMVKNGIGDCLDSLVTAFCRVLMLLMGFTLPVTNAKGTNSSTLSFSNPSLASTGITLR